MNDTACKQVLGYALALLAAWTPINELKAQGSASAATGATPAAAESKVNLDVLKGNWVRPDGGYTIAINGLGPDGQIDAMYFNPNRLPFAKAQATQDGATLRAFFELRAGGYGGSTYELTYDPASDQLKGIYFQAVAKQRFPVYFERKRAAP